MNRRDFLLAGLTTAGAGLFLQPETPGSVQPPFVIEFYAYETVGVGSGYVADKLLVQLHDERTGELHRTCQQC